MALGVYTDTHTFVHEIDFKKPVACWLVAGAPGLKAIKVDYTCIQNCIALLCNLISTSMSCSC